ncbi:hypothetical protein KPL71_011706 [Citrus sinensis]|uniref:Uncharacterized protein n=2 Tax=Citrus sinensis TaxID=2711 RepID=A0ACB8L5T4_CITSI|nr:hypothetical protein KPL71_011706 [Citrus sinensis]KAH9768715.1 hypothetical protein KPL71_011706 [Citrus sinensis]
MEFNFGRIDGRTAPSPSSPSASSQSSSYSSDDQARRGNYSMGPDLLNNPRLLYTLQREIEKEIIRHEIIAAEIERRRLPEEEVRRELMIEREMAMHRAREMGLSIDDRLLMQLYTRYLWFPFSRNLGLGFGHDVLPSTLLHFSHGLLSGLDVNKKDELTMLGKPDSSICGSQQKAATPPAGSGKLPSTSSNKPKKWSCALCQVSATTERGLYVHLQGKKHKAKKNLLRDLKMFIISTSKKSTESRDSGGQEMKTKVQKESVKGNKTVVDLDQKDSQRKKHKAKVARLLRGKKMCGNFTSSVSKKSTESRGGAGQTMKTKAQEELVKANKTVVGFNQKVKGGLDGHPRRKKHKAKVARLLRDKKMCSNSTSSTSKKSKESRGGSGQKMKTKVQDESVKATKTVVGLNQKVKGGLDEHPQCKKHKVKEELLGAQKWTKKSTESRHIAGQEMKTKVEEKSVKANKTVVGSDQKGEGGQDQQVKPYPNLCGSKQEAATLPADSGKPCSTGSKKPMHWSCTLCQVSSTSKRDLDEHLRGKKHKAKEEELLGAQKWTKKSTESRDGAGQEMKTKVEEESIKANKTFVRLDQKGKGGQALQVNPYPNLCGSKQEAATLPGDSGKLRLASLKKPMHWSCALCQGSATSKGELVKHLQGKKHKAKEEELLGAQKWRKKSTERRDGADQEMKTKVEGGSDKANKTLVGIDQKGKGGQALQVKPYPNLCGSKQEAAALPADPGKLRLTSLKKPMHWSCALCQVSASSKKDLVGHLQGKKHKAKEEGLEREKKHMARSNESKKNDEAVPLTTSTIVTQLESTEKVEDEDVVAKESNEETADSVIENAEDEEVVVYRGRQSGLDAADSLLC